MLPAVIGDNYTIPGVFESSSVSGVQLLQSFISVVVMLLLLLSGDVETNPGPTTGKCAIRYTCAGYMYIILKKNVYLTLIPDRRVSMCVCSLQI